MNRKKNDKKRIIPAVALAAAVAFAGCGAEKTAQQTDAGKTDAAQTTAQAAPSVDLITSWESKAKIKLGTGITVDGTGASVSGSVVKIAEGGQYEISGTSSDVQIYVDTDEDVSLLLSGAEMSNDFGPVIYGKNADSLYVEAAEGTTNVLKDGGTYETDEDGESGKAVISSNDDLILCGSGEIDVEGSVQHGICGDDDLYIEGVILSVTATEKDGIHANGDLCVDSGTIRITAASDCMESETNLVINGGSIEGTSSDEGLESKDALTVNGGEIELEVTDDGLNAAGNLTINDGVLHIRASVGDALDSNGTFTINGGTIYAYGGSAPEGALDCDETSITINGGTLVAVGDANSPLSEDGGQISVLLAGYQKGSEVTIREQDGEEIFSFTMEEQKSNLIVSLPMLAEGGTYEVLVDGSTEQTFTADAQVISAGGSATTMGGGMMQDTQGMTQGMMPGGRGDAPMEQDAQQRQNVPSDQNTRQTFEAPWQ